MTQVVNFSDLAKKKQERQNQPIQPKANKPTDEVVYSTDAKFVILDGIELGFGGAFQRDILKHLNEKREQVIDLVLKSYDKELNELQKNPDVPVADFLRYKLSFAILKATAEEVITNLETGEQFDAIFDDETVELTIIPEIVFAVMHLTYSEFDYQRMLRDRWCALDSTLNEFLETLDDLFDVSSLEGKPSLTEGIRIVTPKN